MYTSSFVKKATTTSKPPRPKPGSHEAQQNLWTAVALQQHMLRKLDEQGPSPTELRPPRPLPEGQLSLAQKMGLVDRPPDAPNEEGWNELETKSAVRGDLTRPCAICCMPFSTAEQQQMRVMSRTSSSSTSENQPIILSCSHCFHSNCLRQLEKHAKSTRQKRKCPVCRHESYFRRKFETAPAILQTVAVTKIQSVYRGYRTRKFFIRLKMKIDPQFRSDYYYKKLRELTEARMAEHAAHEMEVDQTMDEIDYVMEISAVSRFSEIEDWRDRVAKNALERDHLDCPVCLCSMKGEINLIRQQQHSNSLGRFLENWDDLWKKRRRNNNNSNDDSTMRNTVREEMLLAKKKQEEAEEAKKKLVTKKATSSTSFVAGRRRTSSLSTNRSSSSVNKKSQQHHQSNHQASENNKKNANDDHIDEVPSQEEMNKLNRAVVVTSCSHLYHAACLRSMEQFCDGGGGQQQQQVSKPKCACCRKGYLKRLLFPD